LVLTRFGVKEAGLADVTRKPNIVFVLCDNVGWGDFGVYGGGTPTPRIDQLAGEGIRFNNYCVEAQCTPTRSAIMTGRQSVRSGTFRVPFAGEGKAGLAPWEYTIGELLSDAGYATSLFGKWHCGDTEGRLPTDQGFDEWWGYRNSVDEAGWTSYATFDAIAKAKGIQPPQLWEGKKGGTQTAVRELNLEVRPLLDELIVEKTIDYGTYHFCPECGSTVYWEISNAPEIVGVAVGGFIDPTFPPPMISGFEAYGRTWVMNISDLPMPGGHHDHDGASQGGPRA
jgi:arylsulfatase